MIKICMKVEIHGYPYVHVSIPFYYFFSMIETPCAIV